MTPGEQAPELASGAPKEIVARAFGAGNRARLLARYFEAVGSVTPANAWRHVYRLLLWIDRTTALAHCYESDKAQPGRSWYARSLFFHDWLSQEFGIAPAKLAEEVDWLFRQAVKDLATRLIAGRSESYERQREPYIGRAFPKPGEDPELAALIRDALQGWLNPEPPTQVMAGLTRRIHTHLSQENKRKNLVGEGFEDVIAAILLRLNLDPPLEVRPRISLRDLPGFHPPDPNEKIKKVDLGHQRNVPHPGHRQVEYPCRPGRTVHERLPNLRETRICWRRFRLRPHHKRIRRSAASRRVRKATPKRTSFHPRCSHQPRCSKYHLSRRAIRWLGGREGTHRKRAADKPEPMALDAASYAAESVRRRRLSGVFESA
ncbi:hypothetical protein BH20VER3_BH20VER3_10760 [soil metagenome]